MSKIQGGGLSVANLKKIQGGTLTIFFENHIKSEKIQGGTLTIILKIVHLFFIADFCTMGKMRTFHFPNSREI